MSLNILAKCSAVYMCLILAVATGHGLWQALAGQDGQTQQAEALSPTGQAYAMR